MWYGFATYQADGDSRAAIAIGDQLYDLEAAYGVVSGNGVAPPAWVAGGLDQMFRNWAAIKGAVMGFAEKAVAGAGNLTALNSADIKVVAPITPNQFFGAASNYIEHADEMGTVLAAKAESNPFVFMKANTSVVGDNADVIMPGHTDMLDWEVELGAVIGESCRNVSVDDALNYVSGYTVVNDISARDLNVRDDFPFKFDWFQGKSFDTFGPIGPCIVPAELIGDPHKLGLQLSVNGVTKQDGNSKDLIFNVAEQIAFLSRILTLKPGDVIATGTPEGVGMGSGEFLKAGDVMVAKIDRIGTLTNRVVAE